LGTTSIWTLPSTILPLIAMENDSKGLYITDFGAYR
jgi:hypothetical protein